MICQISVYFNRFFNCVFLKSEPKSNDISRILSTVCVCARSLIATGRRPSRILLCSPGANSLLEHSTVAAAKTTNQNTTTSNTTRTTTTTTRTPTTNNTNSTTTATITTDATINNSPSSNSSNYSSPTSESSGATYYSK